MEQSGFGESDSDGAGAKPPSKRIKGKSKVWDKVAWFARKSRHREVGMSEIPHAFREEDEMDMDISLSALPPAMISPPWPSSETSSSSEELSETPDPQTHMKNQRYYPNSEVIEQSCLKPSVARALFLQLELQASKSGEYPRITKTPWQKRKKKTQYGTNNYSLGYEYDYVTHCGVRQNESPLLKANQVPSFILNDQTVKVSKHCACCRIHRHNVNTDRGLSTHSLDRYSIKRINNRHTKLVKSDSGRMVVNNCKMLESSEKDGMKYGESISSDSPIYESTSLPNYLSKSLNERRVLRWGSGRSHLPLCESLFKRAVSSKVVVCDCKNTDVENDADRDQPEKEQVSRREVSKTLNPKEFKTRRNSMKTWFKEFTDEQKNILLNELMEDCGLPQIHLLSLKMAPRLHDGCPPNCEDLITWLPKSLALYIMSFLGPAALCRASEVCGAWYELANEPCLWRRFSCQPKWRLSCTGEQKQLIQHMMPNETVHWKRVFAERYKLRNNWLKGKCNVRTFEGHTQGISCVQFDDTRIVSGSSDKTIKVWNIRTNTPWSVQTLVGHSGTVRCLHLEGNRLVSGSTDKSIKVWDLSTQQSWSSIACKVTMIGHMDTVRCLQVDDEKVISGSYDRTLKIWDVRTGHPRRSLRGHDGAVLCVQFDSKKIVSGSCDKTIKVWSFEGECMMTLHGHHDAVTCLQFDQTRIISGSLDSTLKFWDISTGHCINTIDWKASEGHTGVVRCLQADSWRVVSASDDRTLKVWNITTGERLVTLRNHSDGVTCLQFNDNMIVSGSYDKTVKLWDFSCC